MSETGTTRSTEFQIRELSISSSKTQRHDISGIYQELNLYENMFTPCMSGNVLISDSVDFLNKLKMDGDETINIYLEKKAITSPRGPLEFKKQYAIYGISDVKKINETTKEYILYFVNADFWKSERTKVSQSYKGLYSEFVKKILTEKLKVPDSSPSNGLSGIGSFYPSIGQQEIVIPNMTPFQAIEWMTQRAAPNNKHKKYPEYVFYENQFGYWFMPLGELMKLDHIFEINFSPKNIIEGKESLEFLGAREFRFITTLHGIENTMNGVYGGRFIGYDPLIRKKKSYLIDFQKMFDEMDHANKYPLLPVDREKQEILKSPDSRIVTHPFMEDRKDHPEINAKDSASRNVLIQTQDFVFQRKMILHNLMQRRIELTLPGNFGLAVGYMLKLNVPKYKFITKESTDNLDEYLTGKYIITGVRHIIRQTLHETMVEVATDSTNKQGAVSAENDWWA